MHGQNHIKFTQKRICKGGSTVTVKYYLINFVNKIIGSEIVLFCV